MEAIVVRAHKGTLAAAKRWASSSFPRWRQAQREGSAGRPRGLCSARQREGGYKRQGQHRWQASQRHSTSAVFPSASARADGLGPRASCPRRWTAPIDPARVRFGSRFGIPPASRSSGSAARIGIGDSCGQAMLIGEKRPQGAALRGCGGGDGPGVLRPNGNAACAKRHPSGRNRGSY